MRQSQDAEAASLLSGPSSTAPWVLRRLATGNFQATMSPLAGLSRPYAAAHVSQFRGPTVPLGLTVIQASERLGREQIKVGSCRRNVSTDIRSVSFSSSPETWKGPSTSPTSAPSPCRQVADFN